MEEGRSSSSSTNGNGLGEKKKKKLMVAIDESECSHYALEWALQNLVDTIANSDLCIFTVQPIANYSYLYASSFGAAPADLVRSFQENQQKFSLALLEKAKGICSKYGIVAETVTEVGNPKEAICEAVEKLNIQLLVLGSHSRGALKRALLGSVSNYCAHNAKCPVLVVKRPA
ncbi:universal stress protein A-like protein [Rhododendron vialii]|uniref:universal stress protein A-like protein n=1 Tax=Rhododendron vialii TaxID=182163 RepID=UPI00265D98EF|nr:universal stress protein A-like protein [Rhododendron vialii]